MAVVQTVTAEPSPGFQLTVVDHDPLRTTICAVGEFDLAAWNDLAHVLQPQESRRRRIVQLDLSKVTFLDCSCLGLLVASHHRMLREHGLLVLTGVDDAIARIIRITGLDDTLSVVPADQDPFGSVPTARLARPHRVPKRQPPLPTSVGSSFPAADQLEPASLSALPVSRADPVPLPAAGGPQDRRPGRDIL